MKRKERHDMILAESKNYRTYSKGIKAALADEGSLKELEELRTILLRKQKIADALIDGNRHRSDLWDAIKKYDKMRRRFQDSLDKLNSRITSLEALIDTKETTSPHTPSPIHDVSSSASSSPEAALSHSSPQKSTLESKSFADAGAPPSPDANVIDTLALQRSGYTETQPDHYAVARSKLAAHIKEDQSDLDKHIRELLHFADMSSLDDAVLIGVFENTCGMLNGEVDIPSYIRYANTSNMPGVPSTERKLLGVLMLALSAVAALLVVLTIPAAIALPTIASASLPAVGGTVSAALCFTGLHFFKPTGLAKSMNQLTNDYTTKRNKPSAESHDDIAVSLVPL